MIHFTNEFVELSVTMITDDEKKAGHILAAEVIARTVFGDAFVDAYSSSFESTRFTTRVFSGEMYIVTPAGTTGRFYMVDSYTTSPERGTTVFKYRRLVGSTSMTAVIGRATSNSVFLMSALINTELMLTNNTSVEAFNTGVEMTSTTLPVPTELATCALTPYYMAGDFKTEIYHTSLSGSGWHGIGGQLYYVSRALAYKIE